MTGLVQRKSSAKSESVSSVKQPAIAHDRSAKFKEQPPKLKKHKSFVRMVIISAVLIIVYFTNRNKEKTTTLAGSREFVPLREHKIECHDDSFSDSHINCIAAFCKRFVSDNLISEHEISQLQELSGKIFDPNDEASKTYCLNSKSVEVTKTLHDTIKSIQPKLIENIAQRFEIAHNSIYLTTPTCFAKLTNVTNEYSEELQGFRYDKATHKHIQYSVVIFLNRYRKDHSGGRFIFVDIENQKKRNVIVDPKPGRVLIYSSGSENSHYIETVITGQLSFITLSFTCNQESVLLLK